MRPGTPQHPFRHGAPLDDHERVRLDGIAQQHAADLGPRLPWPARTTRALAWTRYRRAMRLSGWPAWPALLAGIVLIDRGAQQDQGWPLLAAVLPTVTCNRWLARPPIPGPLASGGHDRKVWDGPR